MPKQCTRCRLPKENDQFPIDRRRKDGLHPWCKGCVSDASRQRLARSPEARAKKAENGRRWHAANRDRQRELAREHHLRRKYGMTLAEWHAMFDAQGRHCALCPSTTPRSRAGWQVDHDHETGKVRGILCQPCNHVVGLVENGWSLPTAEQVSDYLGGRRALVNSAESP